MPKLLSDRLRHDSIREFRAAAVTRNEEARRLAAFGRGAGAIYLWGYVAEMTLKAGWFRLLGRGTNQPIQFHDLKSAQKLGTSAYGISWPGVEGLHNVECWSLLLTRHRVTLKRPYPDPSFAAQIVRHSQNVFRHWKVRLRYKKNRPYAFETSTVGRSAQWLLDHALFL